MPVQNDLCFRECRDEAAHRGAVTAHGRMSAAEDLVDIKSVGFRERLLQKFSRNLEADITQIGWRRKSVIGEFIDVEGKLGSNVAVRALAVRHRVSVLALQIGEFDRSGGIDSFRMTDSVAQLVREGSDGECVLVDRAGISKEAGNEVGGAGVMRQVAEQLFAKGIVAHVLDGGTAIGVGVGLVPLPFGRTGKTRQEKRPDGLVPCQVKQFFVGKNGVRDSASHKASPPTGA